MMENNILAKLKEFIKSKVELEKKLTNEFNLGQRELNEQLELIGQIGSVRELILELTDLVESINKNNNTCIVGRVGLKKTTPDGGVTFRINTQDGYIDFLYYGEDRNVLAFGMKVCVSGICGEGGIWIAQNVEILD